MEKNSLGIPGESKEMSSRILMVVERVYRVSYFQWEWNDPSISCGTTYEKEGEARVRGDMRGERGNVNVTPPEHVPVK